MLSFEEATICRIMQLLWKLGLTKKLISIELQFQDNFRDFKIYLLKISSFLGK